MARTFLLPAADLVQSPLQSERSQLYLADEAACVERLLASLSIPPAMQASISQQAYNLVASVRKDVAARGTIDSLLAEYDLSSAEGIALMCMAEALLRIPDNATIDKLIRDKIGTANWQAHSGKSDSTFVNAATWALLLTGKILKPSEDNAVHWSGVLKNLIARSGEPVVRQVAKQAMRILGRQFVLGETIVEALKRGKAATAAGYRYSFDMLGEAARTEQDAERYFEAYKQAILTLQQHNPNTNPIEGHGISVKLSALHPRYDFAKKSRVLAEMLPKVEALVQLAQTANIGLTIDAEESERLDLSLIIFEKLFANPQRNTWEGLGLAVQAYQKRAPAVIKWLQALAQQHGRRIMLRLVKGAYWDYEIKRAQEQGYDNYPVFTRKVATDVSYLACAQQILAEQQAFYPQFATHNAQTLATIYHLGQGKQYEFQRLHGMGENLYAKVVGAQNLNIPCRIYAPVGGYKHLLAYLVRRLLENGANTSFVNKITDVSADITDLVRDPAEYMRTLGVGPHPRIPLPKYIFPNGRINSRGLNLNHYQQLSWLSETMQDYTKCEFNVCSLVAGPENNSATAHKVFEPNNRQHLLGQVSDATPAMLAQALDNAVNYFPQWSKTAVQDRAACLIKAADLLEENIGKFVSIAIREAGKTVPNAVGEVREAVDFCRYYAEQALLHFTKPVELPGPTGERNELSYQGRGVFVCISPWNFPLAIFMGQVAAALVAGNTVLAKPAEQTPIIAFEAVKLLHAAGVPTAALQLLLGDGETIGAPLVNDPRIAGVMFTGSTITAQLINRSLAARKGAIVPLVAETGGQNVMIADSSALLEQLVADVLHSAFDSAGQRCSALRVLCIQSDIADEFIKMLSGAMAELRIGSPESLEVDIGPVIDEAARDNLIAHTQRMDKEARLIYRCQLSAETNNGVYFAPCCYEINSLQQLPEEVFGPVLHILRYTPDQLVELIRSINNTGFGLTFGVQSRIESTIAAIVPEITAGNLYVNRNMVGAMVGVQPFGGCGLSGTGPKAGGPHYLLRLVNERVVTTNTAALGGNASLLTLGD